MECTKIIKRMYDEGEITKFVSTDLLRLYEVMDEIYDEYLHNTKDLGPKPLEKDEGDSYAKHKDRANSLQRDLHLKQEEQFKSINKLEIKNRKRIRELNELLSIDK